MFLRKLKMVICFETYSYTSRMQTPLEFRGIQKHPVKPNMIHLLEMQEEHPVKRLKMMEKASSEFWKRASCEEVILAMQRFSEIDVTLVEKSIPKGSEMKQWDDPYLEFARLPV